MKPIAWPLLALATLALSLPAFAEKADRDKPVNLEADKIVIDDAKKINVFEGNVQLVQGTLVIRCEKLVVTQDADGFQTSVATGGPGGLAHFRQKREGRDAYVDGEAERIVYDGKADKTEFFLRARIKSGQDEVRGQYIAYDGKNENYVVTSGPAGATAAPVPGKDNRVRAVIQPKNKAAAGQPAPPVADSKSAIEPAPLKAVPEIANPRQE
ncbi:MAG: lipopolysaccharide transport periplasmic protein LptA [Betaproteobacteria bacterium]|nr:lipopolysaccharide transport periplasmic protein LptA [Betaproteobacteria bacterium]